jgi:hypothetical protein
VAISLSYTTPFENSQRMELHLTLTLCAVGDRAVKPHPRVDASALTSPNAVACTTDHLSEDWYRR